MGQNYHLIHVKGAYLDDFVEEPWYRLELPLGDVVLQGLHEDTVVWFGTLYTREQIRDDTLKQGHILQSQKWLINFIIMVKLGFKNYYIFVCHHSDQVSKFSIKSMNMNAETIQELQSHAFLVS